MRDQAASTSSTNVQRFIPFVYPAFLLFALCVLLTMQVLDLDSTLSALSQGREEENTLILRLGALIGLFWAVALFKLGAMLLTGALFAVARRSPHRKSAVILVTALMSFYWSVLSTNYS